MSGHLCNLRVKESQHPQEEKARRHRKELKADGLTPYAIPVLVVS